ncbi:RNase adapter RapZ [Eubacterium coprostanoligenes]|uniref:RNase adapter RapZ n=1 Tax=Eubacterium coprostanoligenes TaxID=290054 RepID=UPI0023567A9C|nr:RNase adapter RapZ [Eubacterium coprostanoligenes]MCI6353931.1 RNase adapter RapZ [Eubacterium coprostanoligenes]MDY5376426.1 RNase adapter RapZ [Eubacterium coprostanoligenes]
MKDLVLLTGVSGAGKSTAMGFMEDIGYYCIDNMPAELVSTFISLIEKSDSYNKIAIVTDVRSRGVYNEFRKNVQKLMDSNDYTVRTIYLDIKNHVALRRYKLTRRKHPYADKFNGSIEDALDYEKEILAPVREKAGYVIDTSDLTANQLRERLAQILLGDDKEVMNLHVMSFGFKHGIPTDADFVLDVRCLPNPYWIESMRNKTGLDQEVKDYVFSFEEAHEIFERLKSLLDYLNPLYIREGKSQIVIAIGCTGGNHRSVVFAEALKDYFSRKWDNVTVNHRDINRK